MKNARTAPLGPGILFGCVFGVTLPKPNIVIPAGEPG